MNYYNENTLAVIACPAGEKFADLTISHLEKLYARKFNQRIEKMSKRYEKDKAEIVREMNFFSDIIAPKMAVNKNIKKVRLPRFKVKTRFTHFVNGEFKTEILESIRGKDVFIFQDVENRCEISVNDSKTKKRFSVNDNLMSMMVTVDAVRHAGAGSITLVVPAFPYSRQHKKKGREGLTASLLAGFYEQMKVNQILTLDIHSREIENAFHNCRLQNLHASFQIIRELAKIIDLTEDSEDNLVVVAPDTGAVDRNKFYSSGLKKPLAMIYKERDYSIVTQSAKDSNITSIKLLGDVSGKTAFLADDMLGSGGTLLKGMNFLKTAGAKKIIAAISLPFFNGNAIQLFDEAYEKGIFYRIIGTNAVYHEELKNKEWYIESDVSGLFAQIIYRVHEHDSVSSLLDNRDIIKKTMAQSSAHSKK
ncbi:MAG: phosphoribosylpyrophosphate synthetase [Treponema sp.]|nr:MAG: phosphoribosylpyrophosphate synthetase [Treponema sp.]